MGWEVQIIEGKNIKNEVDDLRDLGTNIIRENGYDWHYFMKKNLSQEY